MKTTILQNVTAPLLAKTLSWCLLLCFNADNALAQDIKSTHEVPGIEFQPIQATDLAFQDLFKSPIGPKGMEFSAKALALSGQRVALRGYMVKTDLAQKGRFLLAPQSLEVNEDDDGPANDLPVNTVLVKLDPSQENLIMVHQDGLLRLEGKLEIGRQENSRGEVSWIRLLSTPLLVNVSGTNTQAQGKDI
jgi:hypothetical protein